MKKKSNKVKVPKCPRTVTGAHKWYDTTMKLLSINFYNPSTGEEITGEKAVELAELTGKMLTTTKMNCPHPEDKRARGWRPMSYDFCTVCKYSFIKYE